MFKKTILFLICLPLLSQASEQQPLTPRTQQHINNQQETYKRQIEALQTQLLATILKLEFLSTYPRLWIHKQCEDLLIGITRGEEANRVNYTKDEACDCKKIQDDMRYALMSYSRMATKR